uniref:Uncharacterized protein n=1 Tax=Megaselia scalaris TaxID=36166 RepID=T1GY28_MEGSC
MEIPVAHSLFMKMANQSWLV